MNSAKSHFHISLVFNCVFAVVLILTTALLVQSRSEDIVRVTVWDDELLPTVRQLQGVTGKIAYAYPVNNTETRWRIVIDNKSEVID